MPLSYLHVNDHTQAVTHISESWWFESMYTMQGKLNQHGTHISHSVRVWSQTIRIAYDQCIATFHVVINRVEQDHYSEKKGSWHNPQHVGRPIRGYVPCFSPKTTIEEVGAKPIFCWRPATRLIGPISLACDRYIQYLLIGAIPSVLNRHRRGLQPPKGPARS
jgi:hypothetical protein